ncbi:MAG: site-2 protease family protein [Actinomycetota bacterium]
MDDSLRLGRLFGIPVGVHWGALLMAALFTANLATNALPVMAPDTGLGVRLAVGVGGVVVFLASILAHEFGHAVTALRHGIGVSGVTLWLLGGVAKLERQAPSARAEFLVAVAGPAASLVLALFFGALAVIADAVAAPATATAVLIWLAGINLVLALFNLLPAAPLDGGRVLAAALWRRSGDPEQARIVAGRCGLVFSGLLAVVSLYLAVTYSAVALANLLIALMVFFAASAEIRASAVTKRLRATVGELHHPYPAPVPDSHTLAQFDALTPSIDGHVAHPVVRWSAAEPVGYVGPSALEVKGPERSWTTVSAVMHHPNELIRVPLTMTAEQLLQRWEDAPLPLAVTIDEHGRPVGTITDVVLRPLLETPTRWGTDRDRRLHPSTTQAPPPPSPRKVPLLQAPPPVGAPAMVPHAVAPPPPAPRGPRPAPVARPSQGPPPSRAR